jgi:outer membrane protein assembly factor BamA
VAIRRLAAGPPLALDAGVRLALVLLTACHGGIAPRAPVAPVCQDDRIGRVSITGASTADVAPLAVLEGALDDEARTARTVAVATDFLHARGYPEASIEVARQRGCGVELAVTVDRGPRYTIAAIDLSADGALPPGDARAALEDGLGAVNAVGGAYVADRMTRALDALVERYQDAGWLDADAERPRATWDHDAHTVRVAIALHPGRRYRIGKLVARPQVIDALGLRGGEWFDAGRLRTALDRARRRLARRLTVTLSVASGTIDLEVK